MPLSKFAAFCAWIAAALPALCGDLPVSFRKDIAPLLQRRCVACHGEESAKGGYRVDTFARIAKAGESELPPLVAGKPADSEFYRLLVEPDANDRMPQKADALPPGEIALIERWIKEGAINDGGAPDRPLAELVRETLLLPAPAKYARPIPVTALAYSPDGTQLAAAGYYEVTLWNAETGALVRRIGGLPERITALAWHPKTRLIAVAGGSPAQWGTVALVDPAANFKTRFLCDLPEMALSVAFSPDGARVAIGSGDRTIRFFDTASGKQTRVLRPHADWVQSVAFDSDGTRVVSASRDRTARVVNVATGEVEATYAEHQTPVIAAMFSRDGKTVFSLATGSALHVWDPATGKGKSSALEISSRTERFGMITSGLVTGGADGTVRIMQTSDRQTLFTLTGHTDAITALALGRATDQFATGSYDGTVCVWSLACGTWVQRFTASPR
jgi:WD40 repeat protein/mono/diheme cytochrome c family protein